MVQRRLRFALATAVFVALVPGLYACMWDYDTFKMERSRFPTALELITGKFLRHSPEFYRWRIQDRERRLQEHPSELALYDDLAVAYDKVGDDNKAIALMLDKEQRAPGLYETYANLGTFYLHSGQYEKGVAMIDKALAVNPDAHFGREKYQKYLAEYVATRQEQGKVVLPLRKVPDYPQTREQDDPKGWQTFRALQAQATFTTFVAKRENSLGLTEDERDRAIKGVLGIFKFGKHDSPILLECLGDLLVLVGEDGPYGHGKELAARAYLKASYEVKDDAARDAYRKLAADAIKMRQPDHQYLSLEEMETSFKKELADADAWYADLREKESGWIRGGKNPEAEFDKLYTAEPELASPEEVEPLLTYEQRIGLGILLPRPIISSLIDVRSILDGWMLEVVHDMLRKMKQSPHEFLNMRTHLHFVVRQAGRIDLSLQVVVQILVRVQLRRVTRQVEYFDPLLMRRHPRLHCRGHVRPQAVHDQEHFPRCAPQQPAQEHQEQGCRHRLRVGHEPNLAVVRDRRDLVRSDVRVRHILGRGFPPRRIAPRRLLVRGHADLVTPMDFRPFSVGPRASMAG